MAASEPPWWYGDGPRWVVRALRPAARLYGHLAERRWRTTTPFVARIPVICVGNFTAGGTGKTPFTAMLVERLVAAGHRPAILSRGYGGQTRGPHWVVQGRDTADVVGDEPLLLAAAAPVLVARDRAAGAATIEGDARGFTHIVMDDGLQNPALRKDVSFAIVDGTRGFGNGEVIPAGPLRAALSVQMARVDAIVVNRGVSSDDQVCAVTADLARRFTGPVLEARVTPVLDVAALDGKPVVAFAGIGVPERFFSMLDGLGVDVRERVAFGDHHAFSERDAADLLARASRLGARLLTTEKDHSRLAGREGAREALCMATRVVPIEMTLTERDGLRLEALLAAGLRGR